MERDSARGAIQPGFSARPNGPENLKKSHVIEKEFQPRAEKQETIWLPLGSRSDFSGIKAIKERILFIVSLISKLRSSMKTSTSLQIRVKQYDAVKKAMNSASLKISSLSLHISLRLSS